MESSVIYNSLYRYFLNYEYKLFNTFLYRWESDFFAVSKSGYRVEVEVKVSRGDYFKDFEKPKHKLFQDWQAKRTHHVGTWAYENWEEREARLICKYIDTQISFDYGYEYKSRLRKGDRDIMWRSGTRNGLWGYWANDYGRPTIQRREKKIYADCTHIQIKPIGEILCPNQFYFACPEGMIKPEELPPYAGLLFINSDAPYENAILIKKAPYLHKNYQDLTKRLLKKYYNLWEYKVDRDKKIEIFSATKDEPSE